MSDRHARVEVECETCGTIFLARKERVDKGQGRFCGKKCFDEWQRKNLVSSRIGKANGKSYPYRDRPGYFVQWVQENGKPKNLPWHVWMWELNYGEIPDGYVVEYKDRNKNNLSLDNLQLRLTRKGKQSLPKEKKHLSLEHKNKISQRLIENWKLGIFDVHRGENNKNWNPNKTKHPKEFNNDLKRFIRDRDNHLCQICGKLLSSGKEPIHHIDGMKNNNESDNLILLCVSCHCKVHLTSGKSSPVILTFREKLL